MTEQEARTQAKALLGEAVMLEKVNGVCRVVRPALNPDEKLPKGAQKLASGMFCLGMGPSWKAALKYAAKPVYEARQEEQRRDQQRQQDRARVLDEYIAWRFEQDKDAFEAAMKVKYPEPAEETPAAVPEGPATP